MADRARARSLCAEMHSGFTALRQHCPMHIETARPAVGAAVWAAQEGVRADVARLVEMWSIQLQTYGGPMLFGRFTMAGAYFAPVCVRMHGYDLPVPPVITAYIDRMRALPAVQAWISNALAAQHFVAEDEPYRAQR